MKKIILLAFIILSLGLVSCKKDKPEIKPLLEVEHSLFVYMPWSTNLTSDFKQNILDFERALDVNLLKNNRLIVFFSSSPTEATMFELKYKQGNIVRDTLRKYQNPVFTTANGITSILDDLKCSAPAKRYSMIIGSHGMGWLPVAETRMLRERDYEKYHWEYEGVPLTRFFGGGTPDVQTEITALAKGITNAGIKMDYILFDDCYMSSIEVAYDLKEVTNYLVASPTEIMAYGFPYHIVGKFLIGDVDLRSVCDGFYNFYSNYEYPYGTIGVTVTAELDNLAAIMKEINQTFVFDMTLLNDIQTMDGYSPVIFFDMGDYISKLCTDADLLAKFEYQLERTVPSSYHRHTPYYPTSNGGAIRIIKINAFSGVTISDPSISPKAITTKMETAWYKATH